MKKRSIKKYENGVTPNEEQSIKQLVGKCGEGETRIIIAPQSLESDTLVTLKKGTKTKSVSMSFDIALEQLFKLKVCYYAPRTNTKGDRNREGIRDSKSENP